MTEEKSSGLLNKTVKLFWFWREIEALSPQNADKPNPHDKTAPVYRILRNNPLPWFDQGHLSIPDLYYNLQTTKEYFHEILYLIRCNSTCRRKAAYYISITGIFIKPSWGLLCVWKNKLIYTLMIHRWLSISFEIMAKKGSNVMIRPGYL